VAWVAVVALIGASAHRRRAPRPVADLDRIEDDDLAG
jgi:hypothetical protein